MSFKPEIFISNEGELFYNEDKIKPIKKNGYYFLYRLKMNGQILVNFESQEEFQKKYFITCFPILFHDFTGKVILGIEQELQIIDIEISKKFSFYIKFPFQVDWQARGHVKGLIIKSYLANLPGEITNSVAKPSGKIKTKNNEKKDSFTCVFQLTNIKPNGTFQGSIEYQYHPKNWLLSSNWGFKSDYDQKLIQKYTQEQKYLRFPKEFDYLLKPFTKMTNIYVIAKQTFLLAQKLVKVEHLEYRKGIFKLLHDFRGDCDEFTDLMIVILRKLNCPARRMTGMVYDHLTGSITHHAWPEIYAPALESWVPIDAAMNLFGYRSLNIIPLKIEGTTVLQNNLESDVMDPTQDVETNLTLLDTEIEIRLAK